jgi:hypothetical protein
MSFLCNIVGCRAVAMQQQQDGYTRAVSGQRLCKHVLCRNESRHNNGRSVLSMWSMLRCYKQGTRLELSQFCMGAVKRELEPGGRGIVILYPLPGNV